MGSEIKALVERIPVEALPGSRSIVQGQTEQRENGVADFIGIDFHDW
jgi:hypothetical protein